MTIENFLKNRKSTRDFKDKEIGFKELDSIRIILEHVEKELISGNIKFKLYENGKNLYNKLDGIAGYHGVMIESPHYIVIERKNNDPETIINTAYYTEKIITQVSDLDIDTCWISLANLDDKTKKNVFGEDTAIVEYVIGIGYGVASRAFDGKRPSTRKGIDELVFDKELGKSITLDVLEQKGLKDIFYYATFAPSNKNRQPWRFIIDGSTVKLLAEYDEWDEEILTDMGIIMYYFEYLARKQGRNSKWKLLDNKAFIKDDKKYSEVAEFKL